MSKQINKVSAAGLVIALGIIYGDIGTSPLYVFNAIISGKMISQDLIIGSLSCIIWTLTLQTTVKYVLLVLKADNRGEGGTFALYALVRRQKRWLVMPAMVGGGQHCWQMALLPRPSPLLPQWKGCRKFPPFIILMNI